MKKGDILKITYFRGQSFEHDPIWARCLGTDNSAKSGPLIEMVWMPTITIKSKTNGGRYEHTLADQQGAQWSVYHDSIDDKPPKYEVFDPDDVPDEFYAAQAKAALLA